jgi:hypothetical protein
MKLIRAALALALLLSFGCKSSSQRTPSSEPLRPASESFAWGRIVEGSKTRQIYIGLKKGDLSTCKIILEEVEMGQYRCQLVNPKVKPGTVGKLDSKEKDFEILNNKSVHESVKMLGFADHLEILISAGSKDRAIELLDLVPQHMDRLRLVKFSVEVTQSVE